MRDHTKDSRGVVQVTNKASYKSKHPGADLATCGDCGRTWDDAVVTGVTPAPGGRCPFEGMRRLSYSSKARRNPKMSDPDESLVMDVWLEGLDGKWHHEATCTLAEFFAENPTARGLSKHDMRAELFMRGQWVHRKSNPPWKISFHK